MIHFNAELWNYHQLCVLLVLNVQETNPIREVAKNLAKAEMSRHKLRVSRHNLIMSQQKLKATSKAMSQQAAICLDKDKVELKLEV